jgi:molybdenum cofactor synthesis domain-containing protein
MQMHLFGRLVPAEVARRRLLAAVRPIERSERVPVEMAFGRVSSCEVRSPAPVPAFARAHWDGYAVRSQDTRPATPARPVRLRLAGELFAEERFVRRLHAGEAVAVATGAAMPPGSDAVAIFEEHRRRGNGVLVPRPILPGKRVTPAGDDFRKGQLLISPGEPLSPAAVGAAAACGFRSVEVLARPVVAVLANGNELLPPGSARRRGKIFESNNASVAAVIEAAGGIPRLSRPLPDDPRILERAVRSAVRTSDLVLTTGGSSVGERDHIPRILARLGSPLFHGIAVRPGKPTVAARAGRTLVVGLPGHPASCLLNMYWLVLPALHRLAGRPGPGWTETWQVLARDAARPDPAMTTVVPLAIRGGRAYPTFRGSSALSSLRGATAFALVPPGRRGARAGTRIRTCELDPPLGARSAGERRGNR